MTLLVGFGAINTGNNLLYLLLGMMLALIILSGVLSESVLQKLEVHRKLPGRIFAGQPALVELTLRNHKRRAPSFSIQVLEQIDGIPEEERPAAYFMRVDAGSTEVSQYRFVYPRRGRWRIEGVEVATRFPFELFRKSRDLGEEGHVVVYPWPLEPPPLLGVAARPQGDVRRHKVGAGSDFYGMRDYRMGDDVRDIHWKTSARRGQLILREFEEEEARTLALCLDHRWRLAPGAGAEEARAHRDHLERCIGVCAGLAQDLLARGYAVSLVTLEGRTGAGSGAGQLERVLRDLALLSLPGDPEDEGAAALEQARLVAQHGEHCLVISAGPSDVALVGGTLLRRVEV
jgi:uncharacterized protein (DUF58 family)